MKSVQKIRGRVGPQTLRKAHELFRQDIATIVSEVLQNSRRAGATRVDMTTSGDRDHGFLTIRDDGAGLDDLQKVVTFGESGWDEALTASENAAGMGTFAIASRGGTFRSNGKRVTISPSVFLGEAEAVVLDDPDPIHGMEITMPLKQGSNHNEEHRLRLTLEKETRYYPLPVTFDGEEMPRHRFTDGCAHVEEWQGVLIGVIEAQQHGFSRARDSQSPNLNFHGHGIMEQDLRHLAFNEMRRSWIVLVDVVDAADLKLVLPTRDAVIKDDFWHRLRAEAEMAKLRCIAKQPTNTLTMAERAKALTLGVDVKLPALHLRSLGTLTNSDGWSHDEGEPQDGTNLPLEAVMIMDGDADETTINAVVDAFGNDKREGLHVMEVNDAYDGHPAYDALPRLVDPRVELESADGVAASLPFSCSMADLEAFQDMAGFDGNYLKARTLRIAADVRRAEGSTETMATDAPYVFLDTTGNDPTSAVFVARDGVNPHDLARYLTHLYFDDETNWSEGEFYDAALQYFSGLVQSSEEAAVTMLRNFLLDNKHEFAGKGFKSIMLKLSSEPLWEGSTAMQHKVVATLTTEGGKKHSVSL